MLGRKEIRKVFRKTETVPFKGKKLAVWSRGYWVIQATLVAIPFRLFYSKFEIAGWENVPQDKPVLFAISHRNAFMDSLGVVNTKSTQVWQLARGDAFGKKIMADLFYFFHMLPLWRERDGVDTKTMNQPTFDACADILAKNGMVGIYPEGNCINEEHIRPLKKGICRIAFMAEERYDYELDVHIIPVGVSYSDAENFKKWQLLQFGEPILLKKYSDLHRSNPALAINQLKEEIEHGMKQVILHVEHSHYHQDIVNMARFYAREDVLAQGIKYGPATKMKAEKAAAAKLEHLRHSDHEAMKALVHAFHAYTRLLKEFNFRENTFDPARQHPFTVTIMGLYFVCFFPVFIYGLLVNYIPMKITETIVAKKIKERIFISSIKYVVGIFLFPLWHFILMLLVWISLGSLVSALVFLISFPISGNIAWYYRLDFKKWISVLRFKKRIRSRDQALMELVDRRDKLITAIRTIETDSF